VALLYEIEIWNKDRKENEHGVIYWELKISKCALSD
jgi:hypothetical protein